MWGPPGDSGTEKGHQRKTSETRITGGVQVIIMYQYWLISCDELPWHVTVAEPGAGHTETAAWELLCKSKASKIQSLLKI